jgi:hypothetical protein
LPPVIHCQVLSSFKLIKTEGIEKKLFEQLIFETVWMDCGQDRQMGVREQRTEQKGFLM